MKKIKLKRNFPKINPFTLIGLLLLLIAVGVFLVFRHIEKKVNPIIFKYASIEANQFSSIIVNSAISKYITQQVTPEELFNINSNSKGEIKTIDFNTAIINKYLAKATKSIQENIKNVEKGNVKAVGFSANLKDYDEKDLKNGIIYQLNTGIILNNAILANVGPKIPVKISLTGDATSNISTEITNYGINNALIKVYVDFKITEEIILPFYDKDIIFKAKVPVALKLINGTVPEYYYGNLTNATPSIVVPSK
jgi:sporulation protein YunB